MQNAPLSFGQQRLWFLAQLDPQGLGYNRPWALRLRGDLDVPALESALGRIVARHAVLRTTVEVVDGVPHQRVRPNESFQLPVRALAPAGDDPADWRAPALASSCRPFDLERDPPFRPELFRLAADHHVLLLTTHHIGFDAWSEGILLQELGELYSAVVADRQIALPELPMNYAEYAERQRSEEGSVAAREHLDFWQRELEADAEAGRLSTDSLALERRLPGAGDAVRSLSAPLSTALRRLGAERKATPFMVFSAALALLLGRLERATHVTIGYPVAGRARIEHEGLIGLFVNTLPLRLALDPDATFETLLDQARSKLLTAADHHQAPFERIVHRLQPRRDFDASPLFNVLLNYRNMPRRKPELSGLRIEEAPLPTLEARYDLSLHVAPDEQAFSLRATYPLARQSSERVEALLDQLGFVLEQAADHPGLRLADFSLLPAEHRAGLPALATALPKATIPSALDMFLEQVGANPDAPALIDPEQTISYGQLRALAEREAAALQGAGLETGDVVALAGPPCVGRVAGMLAAFLCGAVAQPLDARRSPADQRDDLERSGASLVVRYGEPGERNRQASRIGMPTLERSPPRLTHSADAAGGYERPSDFPDPATIFFTSGSTGRRKPILGSHLGLAQFIHWQRQAFSIGPGDRSALINNLAFDVSLRDILTPLASGATVCIPDLRADLDSGRVIEWLARAGVTFVHLVPSIARFWLSQDAGKTALPALRLAAFAGEPLTDALASDWRRRAGRDVEVLNLYGPTETTLVKTLYRVPDRPIVGVQPLGRPLPSCQILVMSESGRQCGFAEPGELIIRTPYRSHGYLDNDAIGAGAFIPNPETDDPEDRLFRTGDLGRARADGSLEYLGRLDRQVKIHGVRVDLGEIEATLEADSAVAECAVEWRPSVTGDGELVAYVVPTAKSVDLDALLERLHAASRASRFPLRWHVLDELPLTANGKLDRRALPSPTSPASPAPRAFARPETDLERDLLRIWQRTLRTGAFGVTDDYFDLGGHSLLALQMFAMIEAELGLSVPVSALFEAPTIRQLARRIEHGWEQETGSPVIALQTAGDRPPVFWIHAAGGHVLSYQVLARELGPEQPFYAVQGRRMNEMQGPRTLERLAQAYVDAMREVQPLGPYYLGGLSLGGLVAWEMAQQLLAANQEVRFLAVVDTRCPTAAHHHRPSDLIYALRGRIEFHYGQLALRPPAAWPGYLADRAASMLGKLTVALLGTWMPRLAARLAPTAWHVRLAIRESKSARRRYRLQPYPGMLTVFRARTQPRWSRSPTLGWRDYARGGVDVVPVPGTHVSIISGPHLKVLAQRLGERLRRAQESE